jgi:hypothetical protein
MAAASIDAVVLVPATVAIVGGGVVLYTRRREVEPEDVDPGDVAERLRRWRWGILVVTLPLAVRGRNWRGPGYKILGLRAADARTGGPVTLRSAIIRWGVATAFGQLSQQGARAWRRRDPAVKRSQASLVVLIPAVAIRVPALWSPVNQTLHERLAGTVVLIAD